MKGGLLNPPNLRDCFARYWPNSSFNEGGGGVIEPPERAMGSLVMGAMPASMKGGLLNPPNRPEPQCRSPPPAYFNEGGVIEPPEQSIQPLSGGGVTLLQ